MKKVLFWSISIAAISFVAGILISDRWFCRRAVSTAMADLKVEEGDGVHISGTVASSAFSVGEIRFSVPDAETIDIDLILVRGKAAPSGSFEFTVFRMPGTRRIRLGKDHGIIWKRE